MCDAPRTKLTIGVILPSGYQVLDGIGPIDLFNTASKEFAADAPGNAPSITWYYIAESLDHVQPAGGPPQKPNTTYDTCPPLDILILPGRNPRTAPEKGELEFIRRIDKTTEFMMSVCTGGIVFAQAGILDGKKAMTNKMALRDLISTDEEPKGVDWQYKGRFEVDGKYWTSSGVTAGMDMVAAWMYKYLDRAAVDWSFELAEFEPRSKDWDRFDWILEGPAGK